MSREAARKQARRALFVKAEAALGLTGVRRGVVGAGEEAPGAAAPAEPAARGAAVPAASARVVAAAVPERVLPVAEAGRLLPAGTLGGVGDAEARAMFDAAPMPAERRVVVLRQLDDTGVRPCVKCELAKTRTRTVFGEGDPNASVFFIGEGPGENEDLTGRPFVGRAGQLLDKMIVAMGLSRERVYIANIVKCRPPGNRAPAPEETAACTPYLLRQLAVVRPRVIVTLGLPATSFMLGRKITMSSVRGQWQEWNGIALMPTFHPSYVLRTYTDEVRGKVWSDLKAVVGRLAEG